MYNSVICYKMLLFTTQNMLFEQNHLLSKKLALYLKMPLNQLHKDIFWLISNHINKN